MIPRRLSARRRFLAPLASLLAASACTDAVRAPLASTAPGNAALAAAADPTPATIRLGLFSRSPALLAAQAQGFFAAEGLTVQDLQVVSSTQQHQSLRSGDYDMVVTSPDNSVNYARNAGNPLGALFPTTTILGLDRGAGLRVVAGRGITALTELRGKRVGVDAVASGFAYVLYEILAHYGLQKDVDYTVVAVGGTAQRFAALQAGTIEAALLSGGAELRAQALGFPLFDDVTTVADPYLGSTVAATPAWLEAHGDVAVRFIRAFVHATRWTMDPANRAAVVALIAAQPNTPPALAERIYDSFLDPRTGLIADGSVDRAGLYNVLRLRETWSGFEQPQNLRWLSTPAGGLFDESYWRAAVLPANGTERH